MKTAYHYHPETSFFLGSSQVSKISGYDNYILPQFATWVDIPPHNEQTQRCKMNSTKSDWLVELKPIQGSAYHKVSGIKQEFNDINNLPDEWTPQEQPSALHSFVGGSWQPDIEKARNAKRKEVNQWRVKIETDESIRVSALDTEWDAGPNARTRIDSVLLVGVMPAYWTDANDADHQNMTFDELKQVQISISELGFRIHDRQRTMKKEINELMSFEEITAYSVGWGG